MAEEAKPPASEFNFHKPEHMQDPYPFYAAVRSKCPVAHSNELGGFYYALSFGAIKEVYENFRVFSSADGTALPKQPMALYPEDLDPPLQTKYRRLLNPRFTPEFVEQFRERLQTLVDRHIDRFIERGEAELEDELIRPTMAFTVLPMLGVPLADQAAVSEKVDYINRSRTIDPEGTNARGAELATYLFGLTGARRAANERTDDILQLLIEGQIEGKPLDDGQIFSVLMILLFGGLDTTSAVMGEAFLHLARNPRDAERLRSGEVSWASALEEFVRYASPVQALRRTVTRDIEFGGQSLCPGDFIIAMSGAANHDPAAFDRPDEIIIDRKIDQHLGFGAGAHICLGRNFARLSMEIMLSTVLTRIPDFTVADDFCPDYAIGETRGMKKLPVQFSPRMRAAA